GTSKDGGASKDGAVMEGGEKDSPSDATNGSTTGGATGSDGGTRLLEGGMTRDAGAPFATDGGSSDSTAGGGTGGGSIGSTSSGGTSGDGGVVITGGSHPTKADLLFMVDNSTSMIFKQELFAAAMGDLLGGLVSPPCVNGAGQLVARGTNGQ